MKCKPVMAAQAECSAASIGMSSLTSSHRPRLWQMEHPSALFRPPTLLQPPLHGPARPRSAEIPSPVSPLLPLVFRAESMGRTLKQRLLALQDRYSIIGEVRGKGLMLGAELVGKDKAPATEQTDRILESLKSLGVLAGKTELQPLSRPTGFLNRSRTWGCWQERREPGETCSPFSLRSSSRRKTSSDWPKR